MGLHRYRTPLKNHHRCDGLLRHGVPCPVPRKPGPELTDHRPMRTGFQPEPDNRGSTICNSPQFRLNSCAEKSEVKPNRGGLRSYPGAALNQSVAKAGRFIARSKGLVSDAVAVLLTSTCPACIFTTGVLSFSRSFQANEPGQANPESRNKYGNRSAGTALNHNAATAPSERPINKIVKAIVGLTIIFMEKE